jgi:hypothetical protein
MEYMTWLLVAVAAATLYYIEEIAQAAAGSWGAATNRSPDSLFLFFAWALMVFIWFALIVPLLGIALLKMRLFPSPEEKLRRKTREAKKWLAKYRVDDRDEHFRECFFHINNGDRPHRMGFLMEYDEWKAKREQKWRSEYVARAVEALHANPVLRK